MCKFEENLSINFELCCSQTNKLTNKETNRWTNANDYITSAESGDINEKYCRILTPFWQLWGHEKRWPFPAKRGRGKVKTSVKAQQMYMVRTMSIQYIGSSISRTCVTVTSLSIESAPSNRIYEAVTSRVNTPVLTGIGTTSRTL